MLGFVSKTWHEEVVARIQKDCAWRLAKLKEENEKELKKMRDLVAKCGVIKTRGKQPDGEDRYTIQVYCTAQTLHTILHSGRDSKAFVDVLSMQFAYEAREMLLALSGLKRIPVLPYSPEPAHDGWWVIDKRRGQDEQDGGD